jgi:hypothetical protein
MQRCRLLVVLGALVTFSVAFFGSPALAVTPSFTITATSATLSSSTSSGVGSSSFTLTSVNGYTGSVRVGCDPPNPPAGAKVPYCTDGYPTAGAIPAQPPIPLTANEVVNGTVSFYNLAVPVPVSLPRRGSHGLAQGLALAGALLFGFGFMRRSPRWLMLALFALCTLAGLAGISACGANNNAVTPGNYVYTISATDVNTSVSVTALVNVTVP